MNLRTSARFSQASSVIAMANSRRENDSDQGKRSSSLILSLNVPSV